MSERKKIDRLFQENFRDFEVTPDEKVWRDIEARLKEKKKRRVIPLWWKLTGVAALLLLGLLIFNRFTASADKTENAVVETENPNSGNDGNANGNSSDGNQNQSNDSTANPGSEVLSPNRIVPNGNPFESNRLAPNGANNAVATSPSTGENTNKSLHERELNTNPNPRANRRGVKPNALSNTAGDAFAAAPVRKAQQSGTTTPEKTLQVSPDAGLADGNQNKSSQGALPADGLNNPDTRQKTTNLNDKLEVQTPQGTGIAANNAEVKQDSTGIATVTPNALEELLNEKETNVTSREQKINRWQITSNVAPIYFSSVSQGSPLDPRFENNKKSYTPSLSYGVGAKYAINKKFAIKSGVNAVKLEYSTTDIVFFQTENARTIENVKPNLAGSYVQVESQPGNNAVQTMGRTRNQYSGEVNQKIGYVEVPVEMSYQILDKKFGMEVIGGVSTLFLSENKVALMAPGMNMEIGEADNLNSVHFSTNIGLGFRYEFLKSFQANLEPIFKYQIDTFSNGSGNFKPFLFGIYTGVSYKF